jgi:FdhE protein
MRRPGENVWCHMQESWDRRIERAVQLTTGDSAVAPLVAFYATLLKLQKDVYVSLRREDGEGPTGTLEHDLPALRTHGQALLRGVAATGPDALAQEAARLLNGSEQEVERMLLAYWRDSPDGQFFAKAILQPYAQWLSDAAVLPAGRPVTRAENRCPFCGGAPQLAVLHVTSEPMAHGGGRTLVCATCLSSWPFKRLLCASCGEDDERKLAYFQTTAYGHLRIEACDSCRHYVKCVDLTRFGLAVPIVDEVAGAPLDLWAREHGYQKIELNLVGL